MRARASLVGLALAAASVFGGIASTGRAVAHGHTTRAAFEPCIDFNVVNTDTINSPCLSGDWKALVNGTASTTPGPRGGS